VAYEYFHDKGPNELKEDSGDLYIGYRIPQGELGATTSVQTANQIKEVTNLLNQGIKNIEISTISADVFEMIPKQHLKEINRLTKLTGSETSLHAPVIDPSGFTQQGWNESNREVAENQFSNVMKNSHELNPDGNIPVTIHASQIPGTTHMKDPVTGEMIARSMVAVNQETGELRNLEREKIHFPDMQNIEAGEEFTPERRLKSANATHWENQLSQLVFYKERADELLDGNWPSIVGEKKEDYNEKQIISSQKVENANVYLHNAYQNVNSLFDQAYKNSDADGKEKLKNASDKFKVYWKKAADEEGRLKNPAFFSGALQVLIGEMQNITQETPPQIYKPIEDFATSKASQTLGNVAFKSWKEFGKNSPIVSIENPPYGSAISTAKDLRNLVDATRKQFVEKAKTEGYSESEAKEAAEKLIGATWDTSHISMIRQHGFGKDTLIDEAKHIAPVVKHVHFNDNFGGSHTDLPAGMGTVPMKEIMGELEKGGAKGKKVFEGGQWFQHFQTSPHPVVMEAVGSPLYGMMAAPYWNQIRDTMGNYMLGHGEILPDQHFSTYGSGFATLPRELGGQMGGGQSRFSGAPNQ